MARVKRCIGLDLGSHSVKVAEMAIDGGGVRVIRMLSALVPVGPEAVEEERNAAIVAAVRGLLKQHKVTTRQAVFSMPGQTVFVRRIRLPKVSGPRLHQIIHFEARQLIPFPLEKTLLEYQVFDTESDREVEVLLVAMKRETNQEFMRLVRRIGLRPIGVSVSSIGLFNGQELYRFNWKDWQASAGAAGGLLGLRRGGGAGKAARKPAKGGKKQAAATAEPEAEAEDFGSEMEGLGAGFEEVRAYVNIGARSTDLSICKIGKAKTIGFTRSIPLGGNQITAAIQKACKLDTFTQAERVKIEQTAVLSGAFEYEADRTLFQEEACRVATSLCDRMISEIRRSLDYFISQPDGVAVDLVVVSGGSAHLPYLTGYIEERLGLPVELSKTLGNAQVKVPPQFGEDFDYSSYKIAVGLAMQGLGISAIQIDFLPAEIRTMRDFSSQYVEMALLAAMLGGMIFFSAQLGSSTLGQYAVQINEYDRAVKVGEPRERLMKAAEAGRTLVQGKLDLLAPQVVGRDYWLRSLLEVHAAKPPGVLITGLEGKPNYYPGYNPNNDPNFREANSTAPPLKVTMPVKGTLTIEGESEQAGAVTNFVRALTARKDYFDEVILRSMTPTMSQQFRRQVLLFKIVAFVNEKGGKALTRAESAPEIPTPQPPEPLAAAGMQPGGIGMPGAMPAPGGFGR